MCITLRAHILTLRNIKNACHVILDLTFLLSKSIIVLIHILVDILIHILMLHHYNLIDKLLVLLLYASAASLCVFLGVCCDTTIYDNY